MNNLSESEEIIMPVDEREAVLQILIPIYLFVLVWT
jgi:hypothetical protein